MNKPFERIVNGSRYTLRYAWGNNQVDIPGEILQTFNNYGQDLVTQRDFDQMISKLTVGASSSALYYKRDPSIITNICVCFPNFLTVKVVDNLIKCFNSGYSMACVTEISNTGYIYTKAQIRKLNSLGYLMLDSINEMSYQEFLSLFDNNDFVTDFRTDLSSNVEAVIQKKINRLKGIVDKFEIKVEPGLVEVLINRISSYSYHEPSIEAVYNVHVIAKALGVEFTKDTLLRVMTSRTYACSSGNTAYYSKIRKIINFYDVELGRDDILSHTIEKTGNVAIRTFKTMIHPRISSYDPAVDIKQMIAMSDEYDYQIGNRLHHLLTNGYLCYDQFFLFLVSMTGNCAALLHKCISLGLPLSNQTVRNIFTFCDDNKIIDLFTDNKIFPTTELVKCCTERRVLEHIRETSIFIDADTEKFIDRVLKLENSETIDISPQKFIDIYESLSSRDKKIVERLTYREIMLARTIVRYNIGLTEKYVEYLLLHNWKEIVKLLYISHRYRYVTNMIDPEVAQFMPTALGRIWIFNNVINVESPTFNDSNWPSDMDYFVDHDVGKLLEQPIQHDVLHSKTVLVEQKILDKRRMMEKHCNITTEYGNITDYDDDINDSDAESEDYWQA